MNTGRTSINRGIQNVPGEKINIVRRHNIDHSKQKNFMYMCPIPSGFRDRAISLYSSKIVDKKEILRTVSNTGIYCSGDKVGTVYLV
jgi:predicted transport protein